MLTNSILNIVKEFGKINIYSPSLHQDLYQKIFKCSSNYIPINIIPKILIEEALDIAKSQIDYEKDFEKSDTEIGTYEPTEELKYPQEYKEGGIIILDDLNEKKE